jgi:hypothetical protein
VNRQGMPMEEVGTMADLQAPGLELLPRFVGLD